MSPRYLRFLALATLTILADQLTKVLARRGLEFGVPETVIQGYWDWRLSFNYGSAFGLFSGMGAARIFLTIVGIIAVVAIVGVLRKAKDDQKWLTSALALVAGGAIGNVIDRILAGKVTDFVVWKAGKHEWPAFNIADVALVIGVAILLLDVGRDQKRAQEHEKATQPKGSVAKK